MDTYWQIEVNDPRRPGWRAWNRHIPSATKEDAIQRRNALRDLVPGCKFRAVRVGLIRTIEED